MSRLAALGALLLACAPCALGNFIFSGDHYYVQHKGGRSGCSPGAEFLGFLNKTCEAGTKTKSYGPTCGPTLRAAADGQNWKQWTIVVVGQASDGNDLVTFANFYGGDGAPLCVGNMVPEKKDECSAAPWASRVHIHPGQLQPYVWRLIPVDEDDTFQIVAESRAEGCLRFLGGASTCKDKSAQFYASDDGSGQQRWVLKPVTPRASPPPPAPPPPTVCTPGYGLSDGACVKCEAGSYSPGGATAECELCAPGSHTPSPGHAVCTGCRGSSYSATWGATACSVCAELTPPPARRLLDLPPPAECVNDAHTGCESCCPTDTRKLLEVCCPLEGRRRALLGNNPCCVSRRRDLLVC